MKTKIDIKDTIIFGDNAYGVTSSKKKLYKKQLEEAKDILSGISGELWQVNYMPEWSEKYPMWINEILFFLFNHKLIPYKWERYL